MDNAAFKARCQQQLGLSRVHNFYGMVEQVGTVFVECEAGHLHAPALADVLVRDPQTLAPLPMGQPGLLQLLSALPLSYPGHSLLSEDLDYTSGELWGNFPQTYSLVGVINCAGLLSRPWSSVR